MRAMLTLEIAGRLDEFIPHVFVREPYEQRRREYYAELMASTEPNDIEVVDFGDATHWKWGARARLEGAVRRALDSGTDLLRRARDRTRAPR